MLYSFFYEGRAWFEKIFTYFSDRSYKENHSKAYLIIWRKVSFGGGFKLYFSVLASCGFQEKGNTSIGESMTSLERKV